MLDILLQNKYIHHTMGGMVWERGHLHTEKEQ